MAYDSVVTPQQTIARKRYLAFEYGALFFGVPLLLWLTTDVAKVIPTLVGATVACLIILWRDPTFDRSQLWSSNEVRPGMLRMLGVWALLCGTLALQVWYFRPDWWLNLPRNDTWLWLTILVAYPVISVIPQNIIYRAFMFHRYKDVFGPSGWNMVWASAAAFCVAHVIFHNWLALTLTAIAGLVIAITYDRHRSVMLATIEHSLYGGVIFTIGLGQFVIGG
jgi:membrane protease YdiL (CAAX protease family)